MTTTPLSPTELREREQDRQWLANRCAEVEARGVRETYLPRDRTTDLERVFRLVRELLSAPAAPRERETLTEQELYYLRSIKRSLDEWYSLAPRGGLGGEVLADNRDWLDCFIDQHTRALAPSTSGGK